MLRRGLVSFAGRTNALRKLSASSPTKTWLKRRRNIRVHGTSSHLVRVAFHRVFPELQVLQIDAGPTCDAGEGVLGEADVQAGRVADDGRQSAEQGRSAGHGDAVGDEIRRQLRLGLLERRGDGLDD